jgi:RNA-directed DNA polymerase
MKGPPGPQDMSTRLSRIAEVSRQRPTQSWTTLAHHVDEEVLRESFRLTRKDGAPGVDGQTAAQYEENLEENLRVLADRFHKGTYRAPPVRRVHIPKGDGQTRPIGMPTFEDKVLQRAVTTVLNAVYEQDFLDCSYGFRPGRSAHQALTALREGIMRMNGAFVIDLDIKSFFDTIDHGHLRAMLDKRIRDGVILRAIGKWLNAGILEGEVLRRPAEGTPQGGVISPLLSNIYLHEVLDLWFENDIKPRLSEPAFMVRYADDVVLVFSSEADARRVLEVLPKRFERFGLTLHPEKTRLVQFKCPRPQKDGNDDDEPGTFDFLGFTHHWAKSTKGNWVVMRKTGAKRLSRALQRINEWCRDHRHLPLRIQHETMSRKLRGHFGYYGITGNSRAINAFAYVATRLWRKWLDRRSWKARMTWERFGRVLKRFPLPRPLVHYRA